MIERLSIHYLSTAIILPLYGVKVCPFIEGLSTVEVTVPIFTVLLLQYAINIQLRKKIRHVYPLKEQVNRNFWLVLSLFIFSSLILMIYNAVIYDFPLESGLKIFVGLSGLGYFAAVDLALEEEREVANRVITEGVSINPDDDYFPLSHKFALFASLSVIIVAIVLFLLVAKNLDWIVKNTDSISLDKGRISILKEFLFVLLIIIPHVLNIVYSYARNLKSILNNQNGVLDRVSMEDYNQHVPVSSNDEFGIMAQHTNIMVDRIKERTEELSVTRDVTILSLATLAETRDNETGAHILRTQRYLRALAEHLKDHPDYQSELDDDTIDLLYKSAPLHDVGKVGIPDAILLKPGKLTADEFKIMKTHTTIGAEALSIAEKELGSNSFMRLSREIALSHHEKWDGSGYPSGLKGNYIPLSGRLMAVADVYDALISKRVYKPAFTHEKAMEILQEGKGSHFDPDIIEALFVIEEKFQSIASKYNDKDYDK